MTSCGEVGCAGCDRTGASGKGLAQVDLQPTNANETATTRTNLTMEIRLAPSPALLKSASAAAKQRALPAVKKSNKYKNEVKKGSSE